MVAADVHQRHRYLLDDPVVPGDVPAHPHQSGDDLVTGLGAGVAHGTVVARVGRPRDAVRHRGRCVHHSQHPPRRRRRLPARGAHQLLGAPQALDGQVRRQARGAQGARPAPAPHPPVAVGLATSGAGGLLGPAGQGVQPRQAIDVGPGAGPGPVVLLGRLDPQDHVNVHRREGASDPWHGQAETVHGHDRAHGSRREAASLDRDAHGPHPLQRGRGPRGGRPGEEGWQ